MPFLISMPFEMDSSNFSWLHVFPIDSSTDDSFVWRGNQGPGSIGDEQDLSDNESQLSGSALVDSCLWVGIAKFNAFVNECWLPSIQELNKPKQDTSGHITWCVMYIVPLTILSPIEIVWQCLHAEVFACIKCFVLSCHWLMTD